MSDRIVETYPVRELKRTKGEGEIRPGDLVSWRYGDHIDEEWVAEQGINADGGVGLVVAVFPDEYVPNQEEPGLVATVLWSRVPQVADQPFVTVPYVPAQTTPKISNDDILRRGWSVSFVKGE